MTTKDDSINWTKSPSDCAKPAIDAPPKMEAVSDETLAPTERKSWKARLSDAPVLTYLVIGLCILHFVVCIFQLGFEAVVFPKKMLVKDWASVGADIGSLTYGDWELWRLISSQFVHFGPYHILFNMVCLYELGARIERTLGKTAFLLIYLGGGIVAGQVSAIFHCSEICAGASGGVFALWGAQIVVILYICIAQHEYPEVMELIGLAVWFGVNLLFGIFGREINLAAHIGGTAAGLILGAVASAGVGSLELSLRSLIGGWTGSSFRRWAISIGSMLFLLCVSFVILLPMRGTYDFWWKLQPLLEEHDKTINKITDLDEKDLENMQKVTHFMNQVANSLRQRYNAVKNIRRLCYTTKDAEGIRQLYEAAEAYEVALDEAAEAYEVALDMMTKNKSPNETSVEVATQRLLQAQEKFTKAFEEVITVKGRLSSP